MRDYSSKKKKKASKNYRKKRKAAFDLSGTIKSCIRVVVNLVVLTVCGGIFYSSWTILTTSPYFALSNISVDGNRTVSREEILKAADIGPDTNIFTCSMKNTGKRIEEIPWVKEVSLERRLPDSLKITIIEREPVAIINLGEFYYFDDEGYIFAAADSSMGWDYPVLTGVDRGKLLDGDSDTYSLIEKGVALVNLLRGRNGALSWKGISEVLLDGKEGITIYAVGKGIPVHIGGKNFEERLLRAEKVLDDLLKKGVRAARLEADFDDRVLVKTII